MNDKICTKCSHPGVYNEVMGKGFYYCRVCKEEIGLATPSKTPKAKVFFFDQHLGYPGKTVDSFLQKICETNVNEYELCADFLILIVSELKLQKFRDATGNFWALDCTTHRWIFSGIKLRENLKEKNYTTVLFYQRNQAP